MIRKKKNIKPRPIIINPSPILPFHLMFPVHLSYKDGKEQKDCFFKDEVDFRKYIKKYKIKAYDVEKTQPRD